MYTLDIVSNVSYTTVVARVNVLLEHNGSAVQGGFSPEFGVGIYARRTNK